MQLVLIFYSAILFFLLSPSTFLRLPPNGSKYTVAAVHAVIFALILYFTSKMIWLMSVRTEGLSRKSSSSGSHPTTSSSATCPPGKAWNGKKCV